MPHDHPAAASPVAIGPEPTDGASLPRPDDIPTADVVLYDGHCVFCRGQVARLAWWDGAAGRFTYLSLHDEEVSRRWPQLGHQALMDDMHVVTPAGDVHVGAEAWRYICWRIPWFWPAAVALSIPWSMPVWNWLYRLVADHRYWLFGRTDEPAECDNGACAVHFKK